MANETNNRQSNRQPSMRELANERMREKMRAAREESSRQSGSRPQGNTAQRRSTSASSTGSSERRVRTSETASRDMSRRPAARDAIETERRVSGSRPSQSSRPSSQGSRQGSHSSSRSGSHSSSSRPSSSRNSSSQRRPSSSSQSRTVSSRKAPRKKSPVFWIGLGIYTAILLVLSVIFLIYTDNCLKKYENSQSEHFVETYMQEFEGKVDSHSLKASDFTFESLDLTFVDTDSFMGDYIDSLNSYSTFTAEKDPTSYITEAPVYNLMGDGQVIGKITLKAISQTKIFAILTIMDWDIDTIEPIISIDVANYTFMVPEGYTPVIDGKPVDASYLTGVTEEIPAFKGVSAYISMPKSVEYKVPNVLVGSEIKVLNANGEEVDYETNESGTKIVASYASPSSQIPEARKAEALNMVQTYEDFMTDDLTGPSHGLATVQSILIKDSDYWLQAKQWAGGVDITFTSAHIFDNPKYTNVVVDNYAEYSDTCYSVHIAFSKNLILTRTQEKITNDYDSTVFFILYDDTDDGVENPHWCIADMIATTKKNTED